MRRPEPRYGCGLLLAALLTALPAYAQQILEARDGVPVEALLSSREPTRIRIEGATIVSVVGNIRSTSCTNNPSGNLTPALAASAQAELAVECDADKGEVFVQPLSTSNKPINLFLASPEATYTLLLKRVDTPADTILIRDRGSRRSPIPEAAQAQGRSPNPVRRMKALLVAMASNRLPTDLQVEEVGQEAKLWQESRLHLLRRYRGRGLVGEYWQLSNISPATLVLAEEEFDRRDEKIVGVAIEQHTLQPNESTAIFVIRLEERP